jgi:adenylate cyclase
LWLLGYPDQALKRCYEALTLAQDLSHPPSLAFALIGVDVLHNFRREGQAARERAEAVIALSREQGLPFQLTAGLVHRGWALAQQGQGEKGIAQIREGLTASRTIGTEGYRASYLGILAEAYRTAGQPEEGLTVLAEALAVVEKTGERWWEAELYRLKGELLLTQEVKSQKAKGKRQKSENTDPQALTPDPQSEAEACFLKAIEISRKQQAKSLELRAVMSLIRLRQHQAQNHEARTTQHEARTRLDEAHTLLSEVYGWFTEGFDTKDLQEAKALLDELSKG